MKKNAYICGGLLFLQLAISVASGLIENEIARLTVFELSLIAPVAVFLAYMPRIFSTTPATLLIKPSKASAEALLLLPIMTAIVMGITLIEAKISQATGFDFGTVTPSGSLEHIILFNILIPSVLEELLCRFAILRLMLPYGEKKAIIISAVLFSAMHGNFYQFPYAFAAGILLAAAAIKSGGVLLPVFFHLVNNILAVTVALTSSETVVNIIYSATLLLAVVSIIYFAFIKKSMPKEPIETEKFFLKDMLLPVFYIAVMLFTAIWRII